MNVKSTTLMILMCSILNGCLEENIKNPEKVYKFWSHEKFPQSTHIKKAHYWKSAHWTYEYAIHFELEPKAGIATFIKERQLIKRKQFYLQLASPPDWFPTPDKSNIYSSYMDDAYYIIPPGSNTIFVHDAHY